MKKIIALTLTAVLVLATAVSAYGGSGLGLGEGKSSDNGKAAAALSETEKENTGAAAGGFADLKTTNWAYKAVNAMSEKGIIKGYPDGNFYPGRRVTYGEFIKMAYISDTGKDPGSAKVGNWAESYYDAALAKGYFRENQIEKGQLSYEISRGDMALIASAIVGDLKIENYTQLENSIFDVNERTKNAYDIVKVYSKGIITGYQDMTFKPEGKLNRGEAATVINRLTDESSRVYPVQGEDRNTKYKIVNTADYVDVKTDPLPGISSHWTDKSELYKDASVWNLKMNRTWEQNDKLDCSFDHTLYGQIYLVKDKKILEYCSTMPEYDKDGNFLNYFGSISDIDVSTVDYIMCVPAAANKTAIIQLVPNPFKK